MQSHYANDCCSVDAFDGTTAKAEAVELEVDRQSNGRTPTPLPTTTSLCRTCVGEMPARHIANLESCFLTKSHHYSHFSSSSSRSPLPPASRLMRPFPLLSRVCTHTGTFRLLLSPLSSLLSPLSIHDSIQKCTHFSEQRHVIIHFFFVVHSRASVSSSSSQQQAVTYATRP